MGKKWTELFLLIMVLASFVSCNQSEFLNNSEKDWLKNHPNLTIGISPNEPPYQFVNEKGEVCGVFVDFLNIIEQRLDYKFKKVYNSDFSKLLNEIEERKLDVLLEVQNTKDRLDFMDFTPPLLSHSHVIITKKSENSIASLDDLTGKNVVVVNNYAVHEYLIQNQPDLELTPLSDYIECLRSVSMGNSNAFVCQQAVATYFIEKEGISNLKIVGSIDYVNHLSIGVRKDYSILSTILTKAVNSISDNQKHSTVNKWLSIKIIPFYLTTRFWIFTAIVVAYILMLVVIFFFILKKKVRQKTKELEDERNKAKKSDQLKTTFLANISHEFRTPINGLLGFTSLLRDKDISEEDKQEYLDVIEKSGRHLLGIINDLIDLSKIETGLVDVIPSSVNVNDQIDYFYSFFKPQIAEKGIQIFFKKTLTTNESIIIADPEKLNAVLFNLLKNAVKYTQKGSIEFGYEKKGDFLEFYVKDTGIGIPFMRQKAIFDRFVQADVLDKNALLGLGLGLSITKTYVEMLGGKIWVNSKEFVGSTFYFTIPYVTADKDKEMVFESNKMDDSFSKNKQFKILIAEDEEDVSQYLIAITQSISREILLANNGLEAIDICRRNPDIDFILMDIKMPDMNGYEAVAHIREFNKSVIIIAQTAFALDGDKEKALLAGCNDYITKPILKETLFEVIGKFFGYPQG